MSEQRQAVDFLRRRYAAAIMHDDMDTACRLRLQLDAIMNRARLAQAHAPATDSIATTVEPHAKSASQCELRLLVTTPVIPVEARSRPSSSPDGSGTSARRSAVVIG